MDIRAVRGIFRGINDRIAASHQADDHLWLVCECGDISCFLLMPVARARFAAIRSTDGVFVVAGDHGEGGRRTCLVDDVDTCESEPVARAESSFVEEIRRRSLRPRSRVGVAN